MSLVIRLRNNFDWDAYEKAIQKILNYKTPVIVTWDLRGLTKIPWKHVSKTVKLLVKTNHLSQDHIIKSILLLPNKEWEKLLTLIFRMAPPQTPVELFIASCETHTKIAHQNSTSKYHNQNSTPKYHNQKITTQNITTKISHQNLTPKSHTKISHQNITTKISDFTEIQK